MTSHKKHDYLEIEKDKSNDKQNQCLSKEKKEAKVKQFSNDL